MPKRLLITTDNATLESAQGLVRNLLQEINIETEPLDLSFSTNFYDALEHIRNRENQDLVYFSDIAHFNFIGYLERGCYFGSTREGLFEQIPEKYRITDIQVAETILGPEKAQSMRKSGVFEDWMRLHLNKGEKIFPSLLRYCGGEHIPVIVETSPPEFERVTRNNPRVLEEFCPEVHYTERDDPDYSHRVGLIQEILYPERVTA